MIITSNLEACTLTLRGDFDIWELPRFKEAALPFEKCPVIYIDMADVPFVDHYALAYFTAWATLVRASGIQVDIVNPSDAVRVVFALTGVA